MNVDESFVEKKKKRNITTKQNKSLTSKTTAHERLYAAVPHIVASRVLERRVVLKREREG